MYTHTHTQYTHALPDLQQSLDSIWDTHIAHTLTRCNNRRLCRSTTTPINIVNPNEYVGKKFRYFSSAKTKNIWGNAIALQCRYDSAMMWAVWWSFDRQLKTHTFALLLIKWTLNNNSCTQYSPRRLTLKHSWFKCVLTGLVNWQSTGTWTNPKARRHRSVCTKPEVKNYPFIELSSF